MNVQASQDDTARAEVPDDTAEADCDDARSGNSEPDDDPTPSRRWWHAPIQAARTRGSRTFVYLVVPLLVMVAAGGAAYLKWSDGTLRDSNTAAAETVNAARDATIAMLAYQPDTAEANLHAAAERLTGDFRQNYQNLVTDVVVPGARDQRVSTLVTVPGASLVSVTPSHAVVLVFVNQNVTVGTTPPTDSASVVRVTMDKIDDRWLVSGFDPI